ncbi:IS3 family transposase [Micromonospora orduensis]|uniref:IS3 family transposase n=2 Tax=Micromonospora TaxID=1873 RepID=A0A5C4R0L4_9ACTN|nr:MULTISPECIES: IS3 family transposase [Micromonospora]RQX11175.1 IS3 family transposase [Micromonospora inaquosa]TNH31855.1 IS3 family transposase [Micromonospora orduensis]
MPKAFPLEFRRDVVAVARKGEAPIAQIAKDFGISEACLHRWLKLADVEDGVRPGTTSSESAELRELRRRNKILEQENEILRRAAAYFAKEIFPKMTYPLVGDLAADGIPVAVTCRVLGFSKQAYYAWKNNPVTRRDLDDAYLINAALDIHHDDPAFGYRFIADELPAHGIIAGPNRVARLCSQQRIWSVFAKRKGLTRRAGPPVHDDLVQRRFTADAPNRLWLTDITEHPTAEGKLYLCAIKDVYSGRIVGYSIDTRMKASLAVAALSNAVRLRHPADTVVHSDRGSQFRSRKFVKALHRNGLVGSMGRVGACGDNAAMESFFALLQRNVLDRQRWTTRHELRLAMVTWIERTYHRRRRQQRLGRLTPIEFETINQPVHAA